MSTYVVDASVAAKWFLEEEDTPAARRFVTARESMHAPDFFLLEVDNLVCKRIRRGEMALGDAEGARSVVRTFPIRLYPFELLHESAYHLANQTRRSLYDCLYLALAILLNGRMITADRRLYDALAGGPYAALTVWLGDYNL